MTDETFERVRQRYRHDRELTSELERELRAVATGLIRYGRLPASYAPGGVWNEQAEEDVFQGWFERRLAGEGQLLALLDRAAGAAAFRRLAERSLRQNLINLRERSESQNLYRRSAALLADDQEFARFREATRRQDEWWGLSAWSDPAEFTGPERELLAAAWGLGDFEVIRYRADARKLAPILDSAELRRFVRGLLEALGRTITLTLVMTALQHRFQLDEPDPVALEEHEQVASAEAPIADMIVSEESALAVIVQLTSRQVEVLIATAESESIADTAERLGCSTGTVSNERARIGEVLARASADQTEQKAVLKKMIDLVYEADDA